ncbi:helix-turn-helix domain-containing protein [Photorhabdus bodei]|uniref:helix-turn-helix domain-containing protein n=1 Tax=Photorhabdus TaxID=29487 RepID=UPI00232B27E6|nr:helix-turn-helix domain-containing protein [Photorhabdus bodei]MDB6367482.1 helix-turn-helix domain-containing protein [Photorhabdus bodei]
MNKKEKQEVRKKLKMLLHAQEGNNVSKTCRYWGIFWDTFYHWKKDYVAKGEKGLINNRARKTLLYRLPLSLKRKFYICAKIVWYLA